MGWGIKHVDRGAAMDWVWEAGVLLAACVMLYGMNRWVRRATDADASRRMRDGAKQKTTRLGWRVSSLWDAVKPSGFERVVAAADDGRTEAERVAQVLEDLYREWDERARALEQALAEERAERSAALAAVWAAVDELRTSPAVRHGESMGAGEQDLQSAETKSVTTVSDASDGEVSAPWTDAYLEALRGLRQGLAMAEVSSRTGLPLATVEHLSQLLQPPAYPTQ